MALSLLKYAEMLDARGEPRPAGPEPIPFSAAKPHLPIQDVRAVVWCGSGALWLWSIGEPSLLPSDPVMRKIALDKTIQEFKMWGSMTRKPGDPSDTMAVTLQQVAERLRAANIGSSRTELPLDQVWRGVLDRLFQKEYDYDRGQYGDPEEYSKKITYFYLQASQGMSIFPNELATLKRVVKQCVVQAIHANGECATPVQFLRELRGQGGVSGLAELFDQSVCLWSNETGVRKESDASFALLTKALSAKGVAPSEALYIGSDVERDVVPAKRRGFRTALLLADRASAKAKPEQLKEEKSRPHVLLTAIGQVLSVLPAAQ